MEDPYNSSDEDRYDESPKQTIVRELVSIGHKIRYVVLLLPKHREESINHLKNWDLWGPLLICLFFSLSLAAFAEGSKYRNDDFINLFIMFWVGSFLISINCKLLGSKGSLFQSMSAVGYCLFPLSVIGFFVSLIPMPSIARLIIITIALLWSTVSCLLVMRDLVHEQKKFLSGYPVFLFYIFMAWYAIVA